MKEIKKIFVKIPALLPVRGARECLDLHLASYVGTTKGARPQFLSKEARAIKGSRPCEDGKWDLRDATKELWWRSHVTTASYKSIKETTIYLYLFSKM